MNDVLDLWDWRCTVADLYGAVRTHDDPQAAWALWCATRRRLFAAHPQSPIPPDARAVYDGPVVFAYEPAWRFAVTLAAAHGPALALDAGADGAVPLSPFARTGGLAPHLGTELTLYWIGGYGGGVFLPFADATSGREAYGGGRYLLDTIKGADLGRDAQGRAILDFNFSYFPSCAYSDRYVCPLAPRENRASAAIRAGERHA